MCVYIDVRRSVSVVRYKFYIVGLIRDCRCSYSLINDSIFVWFLWIVDNGTNTKHIMDQNCVVHCVKTQYGYKTAVFLVSLIVRIISPNLHFPC